MFVGIVYFIKRVYIVILYYVQNNVFFYKKILAMPLLIYVDIIIE